MNCPPDAEHPLRGLEERVAKGGVLRRWRDVIRRPRGSADVADDGDGDGDEERRADRFDGAGEQALNCPPGAEHPLCGLEDRVATGRVRRR
ncbi:MAG TPA: hypothetical protein VGK19_03755 [Capsulimonadaceae bacterium]